ncbi:MAG TPA: ABC transporter permease [Terriglobales bacterium]|nr:ABC transporter permease [Terriglobales bacterium]
MKIATATTINLPVGRRLRETLVVYAKEAKFEFLTRLRMRAFSLSTILFPVMFYILFGLVLNGKEAAVNGTHFATYLIATYGSFGVMGASLFGTAAGLASERGLGWLQVKRASPMPPFAYFLAKVVMSMIFSTAVVLSLFALGISLGGVHLSPVEALKLLGILVFGSLPFCAMGLAIGYFCGPTSATPIINLAYLPLSFCSGLWVPLMFLPKAMRDLAHLLPPYHLAQLALGVVGAGQQEAAWTHWNVLIGFTLICLVVARIGFQRDEGKTYG